jgi:hypothetical protein
LTASLLKGSADYKNIFDGKPALFAKYEKVPAHVSLLQYEKYSSALVDPEQSRLCKNCGGKEYSLHC